MSTSEEIEKDIAEYLLKEQNLTKQGKRELLRSMFQKHFLVSNSELLLTRHDLSEIRSNAIQNFMKLSLPVSISGVRLTETEANHLCLFEAFTQFLNQQDALNRRPKFDK
jgi:hypothetical protein